MEPGYNTALSLRIDWADLDLFGHVNNVAFFRFIQAARVNYCDSIGLSSLNETVYSFMVASTQCQFKKPLRYPGNVQVFTKVEWIKNSSLQLNHVIKDPAGEICGLGTDILVVFDHVQKTKVNISAQLLASIEKVEKRIPEKLV